MAENNTRREFLRQAAGACVGLTCLPLAVGRLFAEEGAKEDRKLQCAEFRTRKLKCVIGNNEPWGEHRGGYNGVFKLTPEGTEDNLFVPAYAGLNLEHYFDGYHNGNPEVLFEPRRAPIEFAKVSDSRAELYQPPTPFWGVESWTTFTVAEPHYVDMKFRCIPRKKAFELGYMGVFWASYINAPESKSIHLLGRDPAKETQDQWVEFSSPQHGVQSTVCNARTNWQTALPLKEGFPTHLFTSISPIRYAEPFYYGLWRGYAVVLMFSPGELVRFAMSPTGGGATNPAWDFQMVIPNYEVGREYRLSARLLCCKFEGVESVLQEYRRWRARKGR